MVAFVIKSRRFVVRITNFIYPSLYESGESLTFVLFELPLREVELSLRLLQVPFQIGNLGSTGSSRKQHSLLIQNNTYNETPADFN